MLEQKKTPVSLQDLLFSKTKPVVALSTTSPGTFQNDDSVELPTETTFQMDQVYDHDDGPSFFKARKQQQGTKKTVVFDIEQELEGISVMVFNEDGQGGGIDGICAFNDIQNLAGYNVEHSSLAETQKQQKQLQVESDEQSKTESSNELILKDEIKELRSKNEILTLQLARQLSDIQNQSEQVLAEGTINRQLQVENESIQRDRVHLRRIVATLENEVKRLEIELNERTVTHSRMNESMVATEQLVSQLESESTILRQVRTDLETAERDRAQLRRLVSSLEAEVIAIKTENSQLRCSLATASLAAPNTGVASMHTGALANTSSFDFSIETSSALPIPPSINRTTSTTHASSSTVGHTTAAAAATAVASSSSHRIENRQDRRRTMSSIDFRESQENTIKLPFKGDQQFSTTTITTAGGVSSTASSSRELLGRDRSSQFENTTLASQPNHHHQQYHQQHQQQQLAPPSHHEQQGHKFNDRDGYEHNHHNNNNSLSSSQSITAASASATSTGNHSGQGLPVGHMVATPSGGGGGTSGGTGMQSLAQLIGGLNNGGGGVLTNNGGSMLSAGVHARRNSSSYEPSSSSSSSSLDKIENENYPRPVPNGATSSSGRAVSSHYPHPSAQSDPSLGMSRSLEQFTTTKPPQQQQQQQPQPHVSMTKGEMMAYNANLHANVMHTSGNNNNNNNNNNSSSNSNSNNNNNNNNSSSNSNSNNSSSSGHVSDRTHPQHPPPSSSFINLNAWKQEGYPSEFAYAKAMGVLDSSPTLTNNPNNFHQSGSREEKTAVPTVIRSRGQGQPMVSTTPFGTDDTVCQDLVAYDDLEKHLTSMMSEKRSLNDESERLLQRGGKTLKERTRLTQVEYRLGELSKEISSTRKELTRKP